MAFVEAERTGAVDPVVVPRRKVQHGIVQLRGRLRSFRWIEAKKGADVVAAALPWAEQFERR